ncbi:hypothetical protein N0V83_004335 [Neocucurbitaria cava]|uniref:Uncharacterized protein n=1 Tax=Neocucurbitaria cava TaxID=798079 RepID=A0A9W8Y9J9_9PLEO|nr:hypothetical protein N0V83_004335 [Neocucurbitaria cava]
MDPEDDIEEQSRKEEMQRREDRRLRDEKVDEICRTGSAADIRAETDKLKDILKEKEALLMKLKAENEQKCQDLLFGDKRAEIDRMQKTLVSLGEVPEHAEELIDRAIADLQTMKAKLRERTKDLRETSELFRDLGTHLNEHLKDIPGFLPFYTGKSKAFEEAENLARASKGLR